MELYKNTADAFINYLKKHGYPEDRIVTEWESGKYRIDIVREYDPFEEKIRQVQD